jgi:hypothetical protein
VTPLPSWAWTALDYMLFAIVFGLLYLFASYIGRQFHVRLRHQRHQSRRRNAERTHDKIEPIPDEYMILPPEDRKSTLRPQGLVPAC